MPLTQQLDQLESTGLVKLAQEHPELAYLFRHALVQDAAYSSLLIADRTALHETIAATLEKEFPERPEELAPVLAHHYDLAQRPDKAFAYYVKAGDLAAAVYANDEAVAHYGRALDLARQANTIYPKLPHLCTALGRVLEVGSDYPAAMAHYDAMADLGRRRKDNHLQLAAMMGQTKLLVTPNPMQDLDQGETMIQESMALAEKLGDEEAQIRLSWNWLHYYLYTNQPDKAITVGEQALPLAQAQDDRELEAYLLNDLALCYNVSGSGQLDACLQTANRASQLWRRLQNLPMLIDSLALVGIAHYYMGRYELALAAAEEGFLIGEQIRNLQAQAYSRVMLSLVHRDQGRPAKALEVVNDVIWRAEQVGFIPIQIYAQANRALILSDLGAAALAEAAAETAVALSEGQFSVSQAHALGALALVCLEQEKTSRAGEIILQAKGTSGFAARPVYNVIAYQAEVEWLWQEEHLTEALSRIDTMLTSSVWSALAVIAPYLLYTKARILQQAGRSDGAYQTAVQAHTVAQELGNRHMLWQINGLQAELAAADGREQEAERQRQSARTLLQAILAQVPPAHQSTFIARPDVQALLTDH